ncbi:MAG: arsenate reductase family protein [Nitrosomonas sp.]|jgi:arsenate reductase|uniref:arsenate reductase family protein n=1 Tax=Nitrosomonas sp. TaxID=42353 RepID=UPI002727EF8A|nr:arsenate reductase family protein [Nitrosomonas sp.]MBK6957445.1 arsenate reductase family protein [Nitrosomonas sp.]MDO9469678.1 arsenate reductase family protein [Nitrosomonas sp.]MDP1788015.1 arsenate reductase family protein [Nitrosomonas sp.]MDP1933927.1 arsenate reductase family protein [Nitrosomonas sp.]MDP2224428.1 arsenate reductase family protein [Nitrosomonas sp.]
MRDQIVIYQKPTCSKCRATLSLLKESGEEFESINYYETPLTIDKLRELIQKLNMPVRDLLRKDEPSAGNLGAASDDEIIKAMVENPDLIQRPIVVRGSKARLCRPPESVMELLK